MQLHELVTPEMSWARRHRVAIGAACGLLAVLVWLAGTNLVSYEADHLSGTERRATLRWECANEIVWNQPSSSWRWYAGFDAKVPKKLATKTAPGRNVAFQVRRHTAVGVLRFTDDTHATFVSDAGGEISLVREPADTFHKASCRIG